MPSCNEPSCHCNRPSPPDTVPCTYCDEPTNMTGTKLCHHCYEVSARLARFITHPKGRAFVTDLLRYGTKPRWDASVDQDQPCSNPSCGHPYHRHFDSYENMAPVGCKYCNCSTFKFGS